jgi:2-polyprenyl-6-methoxyphenol hydroxylase-like FAD-dependent oxidoreductase
MLAVSGTSGSARTPSGKILLTLPVEAMHERYGADRIHLGHELGTFEQDDEHVRAHFLDGRRAEGSVLVGADGLRSRVRSKLLADGAGCTVRGVPTPRRADHVVRGRRAARG